MSGARARAVGAAAVGSALLGALGWQAMGAVRGCVDAGPFATIALHVSLLRPGGACPSGEHLLGVGPDGALVVLSIAIPVLVADLLLAACGLGVWAMVRAGLRTITGAGSRPWGRLLHVLVPPVGRVPRALVAPRPAATVRELLGGVGWSHRGPPLAV